MAFESFCEQRLDHGFSQCPHLQHIYSMCDVYIYATTIHINSFNLTQPKLQCHLHIFIPLQGKDQKL